MNSNDVKRIINGLAALVGLGAATVILGVFLPDRFLGLFAVFYFAGFWIVWDRAIFNPAR